MLVTFYQPELEHLLRSKLAQYPSVEVRLGVALEGFVDDGRQVQARLRGADGDAVCRCARAIWSAPTARTRWCVACSAWNSKGRTFAQDWLIVDALDVPNPIDHCEFICDPRRPTPHMVAPGGRQRWEFMLRRGERPEEMERPESVRRLLAPWCDVDAIRIERTAVYRFQAREAKSFSKGRCFLAGDAAHVTPPFAGQGLVAGLRDVANLAWKLAWVVRGQADERILDSYDAERRPHARKIINLARFLGALVMPEQPRRRVRRARPDARDPPAACRPRAVRRPEGEAGRTPSTAACSGATSAAERLRAGSTLPQGWVRTATGSGPDPQRRRARAALGADRRGRRPDGAPARRSTGALAARGRQGLAVVPALAGAASRRRRRSGSKRSTRPCCRAVRRSAGPSSSVPTVA